MTLSLRTWRYGSKASALHAEDPAGILTIMALREARLAEQAPTGTGSTGSSGEPGEDGGKAISQSEHQEMFFPEAPQGR